jgi:hypothetical protein
MEALSLLRLENVSGSQRAILVGQSFQPVVVRVTDSASPPNPVVGASVLYQSMMFLPSADEPVGNEGKSAVPTMRWKSCWALPRKQPSRT